MSSAESTAVRTGDREPLTRRAGIVISVVLLVAQLLLLAAPGIAVTVVAHRVADGGSVGFGGSGPGGAGSAGSDGAGDPYFPSYGARGYDAIKYVVSVRWDPSSKTLTGDTTIQARALRQLSTFSVDLVLPASSAQVNGSAAEWKKSGFQDLQITPEQPIEAGSTFTARIAYAGHPADIERGSIAPFTITGDEALVAGEPESSAWWYPANDHPSDPALFEVYVRVPVGWQAISIGRLASTDTTPADSQDKFDTWHWISDRPSATYLSFLAVGHFVVHQGTAGGRPFVYAVSSELSADKRRAAFAQLERTPAIIGVLESLFGPYPFDAIGGVVPAGRLWFDGLEAQTRPVYAAEAITSGDAGELLSHELSHMWFGDNVTLSQWNDIFDNEAWASWGAWAYAERTGGKTAEASFTDLYTRLADRGRFWQISLLDPGADHLFDVVYLRGPMALQALRNRIGDPAFFAMARGWAQRPGQRSLEEWMVNAQSFTSVDLAPFFRAWIIAPTAPSRTTANGFG